MVIRPVISRERALELIDGMKEAEGLGIQDEKKREDDYKEALKTCRAEELVKMIKTIYARGRSRAARGKKATDADSRYFKLAEDYLYGELAVSLGMERDQVKAFIQDRIGGEENEEDEKSSFFCLAVAPPCALCYYKRDRWRTECQTGGRA